MDSWELVDGPIGPLLLLATPRGLAGVVFHARPEVCARFLDRAAGRLGARPERDAGSPVLAEAIPQLTGYLAGELRSFSLPLDWSLLPGGAEGFNGRVLRELAASVPYGSVVGYGELARRVGRPGGAQAVGMAMGANPLPVVVPCHRVVESDGGVGGFSGGLETKRRLLALEGVLPEPLF